MKDKTDISQPREDRANIIGVVCDEFAHPGTLTLLNELTRRLNARGCITLLLNAATREGLEDSLRAAAALPLEGLIFLTAGFTDCPGFADIMPQVRAIYLGTAGCDPVAESIDIDSFTAGSQIAGLLNSQGFSRFGYLQAQDTNPLPQQVGYTDRLNHLRQSLKLQLTAGGYHREHAYRAMLAYLKETWAAERVDALFCDNDELAFGALQAVHDFGERVHVGVVGFGDTREARSPTWHLTSFSRRSDLLVEEALSRLLDRHSGLESAWRQGELKIRHSHLSRETFSEPSQCGCASRH